MKILVTGGSGFVGTNLIRHLLATTEHSVLNLDKLSYAANPRSLADLVAHPRYRFSQTDITDVSTLRTHFAEFQPDWIIHLAAETHVDRSIDTPATFVQSNVCGTFALLEATRTHFANLGSTARENFRLLHVSTDEVYGSLSPDATAVNTAQAYAPRSPYAASKAAADHLARAWAHTYGLPVIVSTCSNNYGPYQFPEKLIPLALMKALHGEPIPVYGTGENRRDWLHVADHVAALTAILHRGKIGETYHIGSGTELPNIDLVRQLCALLDELRPRSDGVSYAEQIRFVTDRPGHDLRYALDTSQTRDALNWAPRYSLSDGLRQTLQWYLDNLAWWQPLLKHGDALRRLGTTIVPQ
ncbi:dTDP-glucose 4,6-dehydratase [Cephaloticoccus primus]|uniref:dTDP-glucose 4,6-dehydratase n=1 Tax=Cephaloticoccus primus TaxID=1548207 RepID=A0A139SMP8_9BACT|nr:dTDP-glucose 4,6-dehydratase [Cephaloticoccus primus]KXU35873.1 dTDP-glucose 4,6-dehydratase [Cephaloticoccus primus]